MANILDYMDWRGDLLLTERPMNEVDNLIFSILAYLNMDGLVSSDFDRQITLRELLPLYLEAGYDQSNVVNDPLPALKKAAAVPRFRDIPVSAYVNTVDLAKQVQFSAVTFHLPDNTCYIAFRGTDNTIVGWREDFNISFLAETPGQSDAVDYVKRIAGCTSLPLRIGGHSKGGNFAVYAAAFCTAAVPQDRILQVYSNDGPGFNNTVAAASQYAAVLPKLEKFIPESSLIGILLSSRAESRIIRSSARGIQQHNPYTWEVRGTAFEPADQRSASSLFMDETLKNWLSTLSEKQLSNFVNAVFDALEASGAMTFTQVNSNRWVSYNAIAKAIAKLDPELQSDAMTALYKLALSGRDVLWNEARRTFERPDSKKPASDT